MFSERGDGRLRELALRVLRENKDLSLWLTFALMASSMKVIRRCVVLLCSQQRPDVPLRPQGS